MLRAGLSPRDAYLAVGWGEPGADGAPPGAAAEFAVAARLAHASGASLAPILDAMAAAAREDAEAELVRATALAGPRLSARVLTCLPVMGVALAVLADARVLQVFAAPVGWALLAVGSLLTWAGRAWMKRLVRKASLGADSTVLVLHAVRAAMAAGADPASALAAVGLACAPEPTLAADAHRLTAVALALSRGATWQDAWRDSGLEELERALQLPWERGAHAAPILDAAAQSHALARRRAMQIAAGELGVRLTMPLALCLLPAFVIVGIVPLLLALLGDLE